MIKNIIFDFGGVILKHKSTLMEEKIAEIFSVSDNKALELWKAKKSLLLTGKISSEQFLTKLKEELHLNTPLPQIIKAWKDIYIREAKDVNWELLNFIEKLKSNYNIFLFTDTIDTHDEYNATRKIYEKFTKVFKSFEERIAKAEGKKAYLYILKKINAKPEECIFIDDLEVNIKTAQEAGIKGIVYKNLQQLKEELKLQGIMV